MLQEFFVKLNISNEPIREVVTLSAKAGVPLTENDVTHFIAVIDALDPDAGVV